MRGMTNFSWDWDGIRGWDTGMGYGDEIRG